jgi:hypothetical protein
MPPQPAAVERRNGRDFGMVVVFVGQPIDGLLAAPSCLCQRG